jgi:hypothetical protein
MSDKDGNPTSEGTGFFINGDGYILTNYHVIEGIEDKHFVPTVKLRGGALLTVDELRARNKERDIAIIKVNGKFPSVTLGDSDKLQVGEEVVAIGNPLSLESTVSNGIVSAIRTIEKQGGRFLQITAPISLGSSGGPLFNMRGEVIGITTSKVEGGENLNFAIPINDVRGLLLESEGPAEAADLSGDYACDVDVIPMHLTLRASGPDLVLTIYSQGNAGEMHFHQDGHRWVLEGEDDHLHKLGEPTPTFFITNTMRFFLANTFYYDKRSGQIVAGAKITGYLPPQNLSGSCKKIPPR